VIWIVIDKEKFNFFLFFFRYELVFYLKTSKNNSIINENIFSSFVHTLIVDSDVDIDLHQFPNIRRLKFEWPSNKQLNSSILPHLEELNLVYIGSNLFDVSLQQMQEYSVLLCSVKYPFKIFSVYDI